jgi:hypothetical protein
MTRLRRLATLLGACVLALTLAVSCGGMTKTGASTEAGASLIRSGALAYVAVDSDLDSSQWRQVDDLLRKFPSREKWLAKLRRELAVHGLDYGRDVKPALGPELDIAVVSGSSPREPSYVLLTKPDSIAKAKALVHKLDESSPPASATRVIDGWLVVSESQAAIDRVLKASGGSSLADDSTFKAAVAAAPADAVAKAYVNGPRLAELIAASPDARTQAIAAGPSLAPLGLDKLEWISASLEAQDNGIRFEAGVKGGGGLFGAAGPYASKLIAGVPADALAFLTFRGDTLRERIGQLETKREFRLGTRQLERMLGVKLDDLLPLFQHEVAFYVRAGLGLPELSLVLEAPDTQKALGTLDRLAAHIAKVMHGSISEERQGGIDVKSLALERVTVRWAAFEGHVLVTTGTRGIADYRGAGEKLPADPSYKKALKVAGAPDKTGGLVYLDLHDGLPLVASYLALSGERAPPDLQANLKPLQSLVAYSTEEGALTKLSAFLQVK